MFVALVMCMIVFGVLFFVSFLKALDTYKKSWVVSFFVFGFLFVSSFVVLDKKTDKSETNKKIDECIQNENCYLKQGLQMCIQKDGDIKCQWL